LSDSAAEVLDLHARSFSDGIFSPCLPADVIDSFAGEGEPRCENVADSSVRPDVNIVFEDRSLGTRFSAFQDKPTLVRISGDEWQRFQRAIIRLEDLSFVDSIRDEPATLRRIADSPAGIFLIARVSHPPEVIGYVAADALEAFPDVFGIRADPHFGRHDTIYIASVAVDPAHRHRGVGTALQKECLRTAFAGGYTRVTAHVAHASVRKIRGVRAETLASVANWYGTNVRFDYILIPNKSQGGITYATALEGRK
jgi:ribosomal protein S18 acetylase RimI-like enzyme